MHAQHTPLSSTVNSTNPRILARYLEPKQQKVANLLRRLPENMRVLDVHETCDITEYNASGPVSYKYKLYVYYVDNGEPVYTLHTYDINMKFPDPGKEEYSLESRQQRVPVRTVAYTHLKSLCDIQKNTRIATANRFAMLEDDSE